MSPRQNKTPPISQKVCTKMVLKCSVNTSPIMALLIVCLEKQLEKLLTSKPKIYIALPRILRV